MNWKIGEERAANWFKENYDAEAVHLGGSNSNMPDIISKIYGKIEVKGPKAQCGQFTRSKIKNNEYNQYIASKNRGEVTGRSNKLVP